MCMLYMCYRNKPPVDALRRAARSNDDGAGLAFVQRGRVRVVRSLDPEYIIRMFHSPEVRLPAMIHFRLASAGGVDARLCHPFPISSTGAADKDYTCNAALAHNGHWGEWCHLLAAILAASPAGDRSRAKLSGPWSDTRALAVVAARIGLNSPIFEEICARAGRVGVLTPRGLIRLGHWPAAEEQESKYGYVASIYSTRTTMPAVHGWRLNWE
jgi:hypothetical protein